MIEQNQKSIKILLCSDFHHFSTMDVYDGYTQAFRQLNINYDTADLRELVDERKIIHLSYDAAFGLALAKSVNCENSFSHVLFVSGLLIPTWLWKTLKNCGLKTGVIACDDNHASQNLMGKKDYIDYWFSNEKVMENIPNRVFYLPTATSSMYPTATRNQLDKTFINEVFFVGTIYDSRIKPLETICKYCEEHNLKITIYGPMLNVSKDSIIRKYGHEGIIDNDTTKLFYRGARLVVNLDRDHNWNCQEAEGNSQLIGGQPYSTNPRCYEVALCGSAQLYVDARQEAIDIFGENIYTCNNDTLVSTLDRFFKVDTAEVVQKKIDKCFDIVKNNHLYMHRALKLIDIIKSKENVE